MAPTPKQAGTARQRAPSSLSQVATPPTSSSKSRKSTKPTLLVKLKLSSSELSRILQEPGSTGSKATKKTIKASSSADTATATKVTSDSSDHDKGSEEAQTPQQQSAEDSINSTAGVKRELDAGNTGDEKKVRIVQRKRPKVGENGRMDGRTAAAKAMGYNAAAHKLGPKSNQGVINEKLRALDRTGKLCRKWGKTGFKIKSFTGRSWQVPSWRTPQTRSFGEEADSRDTSSNELSKANSSSNIGSERSPAGDNLPDGSSPARVGATPVKS